MTSQSTVPPAAGDPVPDWLRTGAGWSWRLIVLLAGVAAVFWLTWQVQLVFVALFLALVFTAVLNPVTDLYERAMPRPLATALAILSGVVVVGGLLTYVVASVAGQWERLALQFSSGVDQLVELVESLPGPFEVEVGRRSQWLSDVSGWVRENSEELAARAAEGAGSVVEAFATFALAIFCTVFFLASGASMWHWFLAQIPAVHRRHWREAAGAGWYTFSGYTRGTVIVAVTNGVLAGIFLAVLGVPLSAPLAVLVFIGTFIPIIGAPLAMIIAAVVALAAEGPLTALFVILGIAGIGQLEGHVLQPLIMGRQVSLHPVVVALAVTCGTLVSGVLGAVVAVPLVSVAWAVFSAMRRGPGDDDGRSPDAGAVPAQDAAAAGAAPGGHDGPAGGEPRSPAGTE
ncbi:AI-2E family transporter [Myceligenerans salitolerans]|uniref:AI-2E family transporter n=1 Tax=Myceligenerans salitolerans TaxID=1230528 RepID=UPI0027DCFE9F|nr:AI-2E family transporter [Myceligenerans salitolerans]